MGAVMDERRKKLVQQLRRCAHACGVTRCRDNSARQKVKDMVEAIRAAEGPAEQKEDQGKNSEGGVHKIPAAP